MVGRCSRAAGLGRELEQIHLCGDILGTEEMTPLATPVLQTGAGSLPQPIVIPTAPPSMLTALDTDTGILAQCQL